MHVASKGYPGSRSRRIVAIVVILLFAFVGTWLLFSSRAATGVVSSEVETGAVSAPATAVTDTAASGGRGVKFGAQSTPPTGSGEPFNLVIIPDTQKTIRHWPADFIAMTKWVAANAATKNFKYVLHEGDLVDTVNTISFLDTGRSGMNQLDGKVPYIVTIGNHDFDAFGNGGGEAAIATDRSTDSFNRYFPVSKFQSWPTFGSSYPSGANDNVFHKFSAGGTDWGVVSIKYDPTTAELNWANTIVTANPSRRIIILTHSFLSTSGSRTSPGQRIWDNLAKKYKNVEFVFSGHTYPASSRRVDSGVNGNPVYQMKVDFQDSVNRELNSYLRVLAFDPTAKSVTVKTYNPVFNKYMTDGANDFVLTNVPMGPVN